MHDVNLPAGMGCCLIATIGVGDNSTAVDEPALTREATIVEASLRTAHSRQPQS